MLDDEKKRELLNALAKNAVFYDWGDGSLQEAATELNIDRAFAFEFLPNAQERIFAHNNMADQDMSQWANDGGLDHCEGVRGCLCALVMFRFKAFNDVKLAVQKGMRYLGNPAIFPRTGKTAWKTTDQMWTLTQARLSHQGQDQGFDYINKRSLLSAVYCASLLVWFSDNSQDLAKTEAFVRNRLDNVVAVFGQFAKTKERFTSIFL